MEKEKNIFSLIVKNSIFAFLKEKYPHYDFNNNEDKNNIEKITELLKQLERYAQIPDKKHIVKENYNLIKSFMVDGSFQEETFLNSLKNETKDLTNDEKNYILNSVIFITNEDKNISNDEKEIIIQIARFLNISYTYKEILSNYNKSEFKVESSPIVTIIIGILILLAVIGGIFYKAHNIPKVQIFKTNDYQFDEIHFNRYILYKNQFEVSTEKFKKYAVYYVSGIAQISFNPQNLEYNSQTKTIILSLDSFKVNVSVSPKNKLEIDKVNPKGITEGEAKSLGAVVGLTGAYGGAKIGSSLGSGLTSFLPKSTHFLATSASGLAGGLLGGSAGYFATTNLLDNTKLSSNISETERKETLKVATDLIKLQLQTDENLLAMYKEHFETFIKAKYKTFGADIQIIKYKKIKAGSVK